MNYQDLVRQLTPEIYATFKRALELGRWPDGRDMSAEQREHCLQAVIAYDQLNMPEENRVGYIDKGRKVRPADTPAEQPLRWTDSGAGEGDARGDQTENETREN